MAKKAKRNEKRRKPVEKSVPPDELVPTDRRVAGVDVGSKEHWVCGPTSKGGRPVEVFGGTTSELLRMAKWLRSLGVESVAMESTYLYWLPLFQVLERAGFHVILVDARRLHSSPARKTDVQDCQWIQLLHSHGLLSASFRPSEVASRLRTLQRQRGSLSEQRVRFVQWMQKSLDQMNVRVHRAVSSLTGKTGMAIVR